MVLEREHLMSLAEARRRCIQRPEKPVRSDSTDMDPAARAISPSKLPNGGRPDNGPYGNLAT